jgi:hypothetical protein
VSDSGDTSQEAPLFELRQNGFAHAARRLVTDSIGSAPSQQEIELYTVRVIDPALLFLGVVRHLLSEYRTGAFRLGEAIDDCIAALNTFDLHRVLLRTCAGLAYFIPLLPLGQFLDEETLDRPASHFSVRQLVDVFLFNCTTAGRDSLTAMTRMGLLVLVAFFVELEFGHGLLNTIHDYLTDRHLDDLLLWICRSQTVYSLPGRTPAVAAREERLGALEAVLSNGLVAEAWTLGVVSEFVVPVWLPTMDGRDNIWMEPPEATLLVERPIHKTDHVYDSASDTSDRVAARWARLGSDAMSVASETDTSVVDDVGESLLGEGSASGTAGTAETAGSRLQGERGVATALASVRRCSMFGAPVCVSLGSVLVPIMSSGDERPPTTRPSSPQL